MSKPVLEVRDLKKYYPIKKGFLRRTVGQVRAVDGVSFTLSEGEILGLVGESGCGKTSTARCIVRAQKPTGGRILFHHGDATFDLATLPEPAMREHWQEIQMIFQDPYAALNPRMNLLEIIGEPLKLHGMKRRSERIERVAELLQLVGLRPEYMQRYPHAFSGGQRQRVVIARALALNPRLVIADEAVSALDVSVQAQVLNLILELQKRLNLTYLFVAHDLSVVKHLCHRVAVMYVGKIVELADTVELFERPKHPYTAALLASVPVADPRKQMQDVALQGDVPSPADPPPGCAFHPRCPYATDICKHEVPPLVKIAAGGQVACHHAEALDLPGIHMEHPEKAKHSEGKK